MKLTKKEVDHLAMLARIGLSEEEKGKFADQISSILDYVSKLNELDTDAVLPTLQSGDTQANAGRKDMVLSSEPEVRKRMLEAMPGREGDLLKTKAVFEEQTKDF